MIRALKLSRYIRNGAVFVSLLGNFSPGYAAINKQTVALQTSHLPAQLNIGIGVGGLTYDLWYAPGACTAASVNESKNAEAARLTFQSPEFSFQVGFSAYGTYCVWVDAWLTDGVTKLPATVYTTVTVSAPKNAANDGSIKITPAPNVVGVTVGSAGFNQGNQ